MKICMARVAGFIGTAGAAHAIGFAEIDANGDGQVNADEHQVAVGTGVLPAE